MKEESLKQIEILESLLKEGISIVNGEEVNIEAEDLVEKYLPNFSTLSHEEQIREYDKLVKEYDESSEQSRLIASIAYFKAKRGLLKMKYYGKFEILFKQGLLNNESDKMKKIISLTEEIKKSLRRQSSIFNDIEIRPILPVILGLFWDALVPQDYINSCNNEIKCCMRNKYYDMASNYLDSIYQRKTSLNSKKLAIMNYMKQIQDKCALLVPYEIEYKMDYEKYTGRKCDKKHLENKKRN